MIGGIVRDLLSWYWMFLINIPLGIILVVASVILLPKGKEIVDTVMPDRSSFVFVFAEVTLTIGTMYEYVDSFLYPSVSATACVIGIVLTLLSLVRPFGKGKPLAALPILRNLKFVTVSVIFLLSTMMGAETMYLLPFYISIAESMNFIAIRLTLAVESLVTIVVAVLMSRWCDSKGCRAPATVSLAPKVRSQSC